MFEPLLLCITFSIHMANNASDPPFLEQILCLPRPRLGQTQDFCPCVALASPIMLQLNSTDTAPHNLAVKGAFHSPMYHFGMSPPLAGSTFATTSLMKKHEGVGSLITPASISGLFNHRSLHFL
ncbi:hypothetical protein PIB30_066954 [Stylosanthes scabra]|uniref:Uncharacterized protein n=1 Tax=Stylosanthes scabra TaxID=79078 RepID=A0ABU6SMK4_9FABA|nr:hypothetical protein [Stylosanthes scabra]